jgi:hypothetical protein
MVMVKGWLLYDKTTNHYTIKSEEELMEYELKATKLGELL